jgi:hypothetical protein
VDLPRLPAALGARDGQAEEARLHACDVMCIVLHCIPLQMLADPLMVPQIVARVGPAAMLDWLAHLAGLAAYTFLHWDVQVGGKGGRASRRQQGTKRRAFAGGQRLSSSMRGFHSPKPQGTAARPQKYGPLIERLPPGPRFLMRRAMDSWKFGAGKDYRL